MRRYTVGGSWPPAIDLPIDIDEVPLADVEPARFRCLAPFRRRS